jgi:glutamyl-tRNA synthetase
MRERVRISQRFLGEWKILFRMPDEYDQSVVNKWNEDAVKVLTAFKTAIAAIDNFTAPVAKETRTTASLNIGIGKILQGVGLPLLEQGRSDDDDYEIIGKQEVIARIEKALNTLKVKWHKYLFGYLLMEESWVINQFLWKKRQKQ